MHRFNPALTITATALLTLPMLSGVANATSSSAAGQSAKPVVVVSGLNNPRQLSLTNGNVLLIAEAGNGGTLATFGGPEGGPQGIGRTGSISAVWAPQHTRNASPRRIVTGLLSAAAPDGSGAVGSDGVSAYSLDNISIQETFFPPAVVPARDVKFNGQLLRSHEGDKPKAVANIAAFEASHNPDGQAIDSDPYAVLQLPDYQLVADAAANDVLKVDKRGHISVFHKFANIVNPTCLAPQLQQPPPNLPGCQFVPTSLDTDKYGHVYVGALAGLVPGQGRVVELSADGKHVLHTWTGFTAVTGVAVNDDGTLYVSQLFADEAAPINPAVQGVLTKITRSGKVSNLDVPFPAGVATDHCGNVYVSAFSIAPSAGLADPSTGVVLPGTSGQVWRLHW